MTDWDRYIAYKCRNCGDDCINFVDEKCAKSQECRVCFVIELGDDRRRAAVETDGGQPPQATEQRSEGHSRAERPEATPCGSTRKPSRTPPTGGRGLSFSDQEASR